MHACMPGHECIIPDHANDIIDCGGLQIHLPITQASMHGLSESQHTLLAQGVKENKV